MRQESVVRTGRARRFLQMGALGAGGLLLLGGAYVVRQVVLVGTAYVSKTVCSGVFVSGRKAHSILAEEIRANDPGFLWFVTVEIDRMGGRVSSRFLGLAQRVAVFREGLGCTLAVGTTAAEVAARGLPAGGPPRAGASWPNPAPTRAGRPAVVSGVLASAVEDAFAEPTPARPRRTRAVLVVHAGRIVAERYAAGYGPDAVLPGWSMTKSALNAVVGVLVREGKLSLDGPLAVEEWGGPNDARGGITLRELLRMESGLEFSESYGNPLGDVLWMLFGTGDAGGFAARKALAAKPGSRWSYASGTSNIIARALRSAVGGREADYVLLPRRAVFEPLDMGSALIEPDATGTFVASSFMFASARDWARLGLLYLEDGIWQGRRILPEGWTAFSVAPAPASPGGIYGAHFWRRLPRTYAASGDDRLPPDAYHAIGHEGQFLTMVPSRDLVVVRLGLSVGQGIWDHAEFLRRVLEAVPG